MSGKTKDTLDLQTSIKNTHKGPFGLHYSGLEKASN